MEKVNLESVPRGTSHKLYGVPVAYWVRSADHVDIIAAVCVNGNTYLAAGGSFTHKLDTKTDLYKAIRKALAEEGARMLGRSFSEVLGGAS